MGFFDMKAICAVCEKEVGLNRHKIADKNCICPSCFKDAGFNIGMAHKPIKQMTVEDIHFAIEAKNTNNDELSSFNPSKKIGTFVEFDDTQKKWLILTGFLGKRDKSKVFNYSDIVDFELLEDGESVTQGGLGRALVGGALFGGAGAVVGGVTGKRKNKAICNSLKIKVTLRDVNNPLIYITFLNTATKKDGFMYKTNYQLAHECLSAFQIICNEQEVLINNNGSNKIAGSAADEIKKFKNLLDEGILTQDEFDAKKKELLSL
ncbi:SHOCT domain-containing protein [Sporosarcina sp. FSL K6-1508]|uniref:SHOCT domain-containing protein n=1 Tax=Sporosarcina sp. FSL K6-1508 TaxID=2921553 RepID=UPI0030F548B0